MSINFCQCREGRVKGRSGGSRKSRSGGNSETASQQGSRFTCLTRKMSTEAKLRRSRFVKVGSGSSRSEA